MSQNLEELLAVQQKAIMGLVEVVKGMKGQIDSMQSEIDKSKSEIDKSKRQSPDNSPKPATDDELDKIMSYIKL